MDLSGLVQERRERSTLDDDADDVRRDDEDPSDHNSEERARARAPPAQRQPAEPSHRSHGNTGVKGVLADYAEAREWSRVDRELKKLKLQDEMRKRSVFVRSDATEATADRDSDEDERRRSEGDSDLDELLEEDDDFMRQYERKRLAEIRAAQSPTFGMLQQIRMDEFLSCIDNERPGVAVIVHYFQSYIPACAKLNLALGQLAQKYLHAKFVKIVASEASDTLDDIALPAVSVYRSGNLEASFVRFADQLPAEYDMAAVENFFRANNILRQRTG